MFATFSDLFLGFVCPGCCRPGYQICGVCRAEFYADARPVHRRHLPNFPIFAAADYSASIKRMLVGYKENRIWRIAPFLAAQLARAVLPILVFGQYHDVVLIPVPSAKARIRKRGLDTTLILAKKASQILASQGFSAHCSPALVQNRSVKDQRKLNALQRRENLAQGLRVTRHVASRPVVIIDDIITTGASISAAYSALTSEGSAVCGAATVAAHGWI